MRATSLIVSCVLLATTTSTSALSLWRRQGVQPPSCAAPCLNTGTNNVTLDGCADSDAACLCRSTNYVQGVINCFATQCPSHDDVLTSIQFSTSFCGIAGVNTAPPSLTTPASQLSPSTGTPSASSSPSPSASPSPTTSRNAAGQLEPGSIIAAVVLAAVGVAASL
ncbi:hypothetical protein M408DRAFT_10706 [Serendipita vermifera MAFF 305830]|uniref:CFEM domain-containing protein n=1 Tax=Serendipita vermifera MAFF 305830 TaxID=933852 RepID=A0A0C3AKC3_SERVB|nr:hypothetical protein M408DRAFT_10706 [Serendipita vermifera MAFF 305830]